MKLQHRAGAGAGTGARAGTGAGVKIRGKVEPELEPKINGFDSATLEKTDPSNKHPGAEEGPEVNILSLRYSLTLIPLAPVCIIYDTHSRWWTLGVAGDVLSL